MDVHIKFVKIQDTEGNNVIFKFMVFFVTGTKSSIYILCLY